MKKKILIGFAVMAFFVAAQVLASLLSARASTIPTPPAGCVAAQGNTTAECLGTSSGEPNGVDPGVIAQSLAACAPGTATVVPTNSMTDNGSTSQGDCETYESGETSLTNIHFCLGSKAPRNKGLVVEPLSGWEFSLELEIGQKQIIVTRCVDAPGDVLVEGDVSDWPIRSKRLSGSSKYSIKEWNALLGYHYFGLSIDGEDKKYEPSFRSLIPFFIRRQKDAFSTPFEHHRKQKEWDKQINNAYLLGLA